MVKGLWGQNDVGRRYVQPQVEEDVPGEEESDIDIDEAFSRYENIGDLTDPIYQRVEANYDVEYDDHFPNDETGDSNREAWLQSMHTWQTGLQGWTGERVLGEGTYGIAGKWTYNGDDLDTPKHVVVKESKHGHQSLRREARMLELLSGRSNHIVRMYGGLRVEKRRPRGGLSQQDINSRETETLRIFTEYCDRGDMANFIDTIWTS